MQDPSNCFRTWRVRVLRLCRSYRNWKTSYDLRDLTALIVFNLFSHVSRWVVGYECTQTRALTVVTELTELEV